MKTKQVLIYFVVAAVAASLSILLYRNWYASKTAYIEVKKVFNAFTLKKELENKYTLTVKQRTHIVDSLSIVLQNLATRIQSNTSDKDLMKEFEEKREHYFRVKQRLEEDNAALSNKYDAQILEQMTQYVADYGKRHNYRYIFGAEGSGTLMYAGETENISDDVIAFINNRYNGVE